MSRGFVGLCFLAFVVGIVYRLGDARRFAELLQRSRPIWLVLAGALQASTYVCAGSIWWLVLRRSGASRPLWRMTLLSVAKLFTDQALPSAGVAGTLVVVRALVRQGTPLGVATAAMVVNLLAFYAAFVVAAAASVLFLWLRHDLNTVLVTMATLLFVVALTVPSSLLLLLRGEGSRVHRGVARIPKIQVLLSAFAQAPRDRIRDPVALAGAFGIQLATITLDAATLYSTLVAVGESVRPDLVFSSFVFAMIAGVIGVVPGGLGTFEGTCVGLLHLSHVALEPALAATLLLRGLTFWIPMLPGVWLFQRELRTGRTETRPGSRSHQ